MVSGGFLATAALLGRRGPVTADSAWASSAPSPQPDPRLHEVTDPTCPVLVPPPPCHRQHPPEAGVSSQLHKSSPNTIDV